MSNISGLEPTKIELSSDSVDPTVMHLSAVRIVSAYVSNNPTPIGDLPGLIQSVHAALTGSAPAPAVPAAPLKPAVDPEKSVTHDYLICLEDGKQFKALKRHLMTEYGMTPAAYRAKWNLPTTYPMTSKGYSERRSALAKANGLGQQHATQAA